MLERRRQKPIADINIVPYVDVMLVLLVIFMVTAPLLTQGVQVDLPQAKSDPLPPDQKPPVVVTIDSKGLLFLENTKTPVPPAELTAYVQNALKHDPARTILVRGDKNVDYGRVMGAMVLLKKSGAAKVGLMTQHYEE